MATVWRVLIVEDEEIGNTLVDAIQTTGWLDADNQFTATLLSSFDEAVEELDRSRFDLLVLDLKDRTGTRVDGDEDEAEPGLRVLRRLRATRFVPVIFYTALPDHVADMKSAFVRVIEKTEGYRKVRSEIAGLIKTGLPRFARYLEEQQREYFWDLVGKHLPEDVRDGSVDLTYLIAQRLAASLRVKFSKAATAELGGEQPAQHLVHPIEFYILPPVQSFWMAGDLIKRKGTDDHFAVVTPTCDLTNEKAEFMILAKCVRLTDCGEYQEWMGQDIPPTFRGSIKKLQQLMKDNRSGGQRERFMFLPGTATFPDLVLDLQQLTSVGKGEQATFDRLASLDSPFAEKLVSLFARYYGRIGTPNLDLDIAMALAKGREEATVRASKT